ncbi:QWRF motif-containing protein 7-like [Silene latifolia]|uniref:QWRF motif-containing protein 7-like n=1 Tax=Silene latifolia TaxID=37657 RepID=UPI003D783EA7
METTTTTTATNSKIRRLQSAGIPRSPRLSRSSNGRSNPSLAEIQAIRPNSPQQSLNRSSSVSLPEIQALALSRPASPQIPITRTTRSATTSPRPSIHRSRSTTKSRGATPTRKKDDEQNYVTIPISKTLESPQRRLSFESRGDQKSNFVRQTNLAKLFRSSSSQNVNAKGGEKTLPGSPSSWALSPSRSFPGPPMTPPDSPKVKAVSGVLKLFNKQKKVTSAQEEEYHQYKIMCSTLVQWRFVNAKAEAAAAKVKKKAEGKLFGLWLKLYKMRYAIAEKRMKVERLQQKVRLLEIVSPQIELLNEWEKLEKKNVEAIGRVTRKLSAYSTKLPLVNGAMAELVSLFDAMKLALEVMDNIEDTIIKFHFEAEKLSKMLRELIAMVEINMECFNILEKEIASMMSLEAHEKSLVVHLIQAHTKAEEAQRNCKLHLMRSFKNKETSSIFSMLNVS